MSKRMDGCAEGHGGGSGGGRVVACGRVVPIARPMCCVVAKT